MSRLFAVLVGIAAVVVLVAVPSGLAEPGPVTTYTDPAGDAGTAPDVASIGVSSTDGTSFETGRATTYFDFNTTFATPFAGKSRYSIYFDTDRNRKTGNTEGAEYRLRLFPDGDFSLARWTSDYGWVDRDASVMAGPPAPDHTSLDVSIDRAEIGGAKSFDFYVISYDTATDDEDDVPESSLLPYPASASWKHDQAAAARAVLQQSDLHSPAWRTGADVAGAGCDGAQPVATAGRSFAKTSDTGAVAAVHIYASVTQAHHVFTSLRGNLVRCFASQLTKAERARIAYSTYRLAVGSEAAGLAGTLREGRTTWVLHDAYARVGRAIVSFSQNAPSARLSFSNAQEAALLRVMASRL